MVGTMGGVQGGVLFSNPTILKKKKKKKKKKGEKRKEEEKKKKRRKERKVEDSLPSVLRGRKRKQTPKRKNQKIESWCFPIEAKKGACFSPFLVKSIPNPKKSE